MDNEITPPTETATKRSPSIEAQANALLRECHALQLHIVSLERRADDFLRAKKLVPQG